MIVINVSYVGTVSFVPVCSSDHVPAMAPSSSGSVDGSSSLPSFSSSAQWLVRVQEHIWRRER